MFKKIAAVVISAIVAGAVVLPSTAHAAEGYVDAHEEWGVKHSIITVVGSGHGKLKLTAKQSGKKLKVTKHHRGVWTVVVKNGKKVRLTVRDRDGKASFAYRA